FRARHHLQARILTEQGAHPIPISLVETLQAYREKFTTGMSPAIEDGDIRISDSGAIALYLGSQHGQLIPADPARRALMFQAILVEASLLAPTVGGQGLFGELYKPEAERNAARIAELRQKAERVVRSWASCSAKGRTLPKS